MDLLELFLRPGWLTAERRTRQVREELDRERLRRRITAGFQDAEVAALTEENDRLRLWLAALTEVLVAKGVLADQDLREVVERLKPPPPPAEEENPFAGLGRSFQDGTRNLQTEWEKMMEKESQEREQKKKEWEEQQKAIIEGVKEVNKHYSGH
jgi:hypothetical protein